MKGRNRRSAIWALNLEILEQVVKEAKTFREILAYFGLENKGDNNNTLKKRLDEAGISYEHIYLNRYSGIVNHSRRKMPKLKDVMKRNSSYCRSNLKRRLIKNKILPYECSICGNNGTWRGAGLSLILDHINGVANDHRLENLRFLCPNCSSQLPTHCGKHKRKSGKYGLDKCGELILLPPTEYLCKRCGRKINRSKTRQCRACYSETTRRVARPPLDVLCKINAPTSRPKPSTSVEGFRAQVFGLP